LVALHIVAAVLGPHLSHPWEPWESETPILHNVPLDFTSVPGEWHPDLLNGLRREHECNAKDDRHTDDRQTDHATETGRGIGGINCTARSILLNIAVSISNGKFPMLLLYLCREGDNGL